MQFCKQCGGALNLFETNDEQLCRSCEKKTEKQQPPAPKSESGVNGISGAVFSLENGMLTLRAKEGWTLWSGPADKDASLEDILKRARRIHQIRTKRNGVKK